MTRSSRISADLGYQLGLISFIRASSILRNPQWLPSISPRRLPRSAGVLAGGLVGAPLAMYERARHGRRIADHDIGEAPVFIVGHWRSGTTHLHNLMSQDDQFGCVRMAQAIAPDCSISTAGWLPQLFDRVFPRKRPMDNLTWPMDAPQEEEIPLAKMTPYSWYLQFFFPDRALDMFKLGVMFDGAPTRARREFEQKYRQVLKIASMHDGGRRLLLKNPVNTARIPVLLDMFPNAKFVAIHRSPHEVFPSAVNLHRKILGLTSFQEFDEALIEKNVLEIYELVMDAYLRDRELIPEENLVEVAYSDLDVDPMGVVGGIYRDLGIDGWEDARQPIADYVESQRSYKKNGFTISDRAAELVNTRWGFALKALGYDPHPVAA